MTIINSIVVIDRPSFLLTTEELLGYLGAKRSTIDQYNREGMPRFFVGKECRYIPEKVVEWLERRSESRISPQENIFDPRKDKLS